MRTGWGWASFFGSVPIHISLKSVKILNFTISREWIRVTGQEFTLAWVASFTSGGHGASSWAESAAHGAGNMLESAFGSLLFALAL